MALPRLDIRGKLDPDWHERLVRAAKRDGLDLNEYVEKVVMRHLKKRLHEYSLDKAAFDDVTDAGQNRSRQGKP